MHLDEGIFDSPILDCLRLLSLVALGNRKGARLQQNLELLKAFGTVVHSGQEGKQRTHDRLTPHDTRA